MEISLVKVGQGINSPAIGQSYYCDDAGDMILKNMANIGLYLSTIQARQAQPGA